MACRSHEQLAGASKKAHPEGVWLARDPQDVVYKGWKRRQELLSCTGLKQRNDVRLIVSGGASPISIGGATRWRLTSQLFVGQLVARVPTGLPFEICARSWHSNHTAMMLPNGGCMRTHEMQCGLQKVQLKAVAQNQSL